MRELLKKLIEFKSTLLWVSVFLLFSISASADWVSPNGFSDAEDKWTTEANAYDENTSTYASDGSLRTGWGAFIVLDTPSALNCSRIRLNADYGADVDMVDVDVYRDGAWVDVYEGAIANSQWVEKTFAVGSVTQARFRWHYVNSNYLYWLYEFDFYEEPAIINTPSSQTDAPSKVEESTAILHGTVLNDGGEPCEYRFQYGVTAAYGTDTPWRSSRVTGEVFAELITGLVDGQLYHVRAQLKNSAGTSSGADVTFRSGTPSSGWVSPSGNNDPDGKWENEYQSYDDDLNTIARSYHDINDAAGQWSSFLYLTHASVLSDKIRYYARGTTTDDNFVDQIDVDVYRDGAWVDVYEGAVGNHVWEERTFAQGNVTEARIRFHINNNNAGLFFELYEFNFFRISLSPPVLTWTGETDYVSDGVNPEAGDALTDFTFRVEYTDADNDAPAYMRLHLDKNGDGDYSDAGETIDMSVATTGAPAKRDGDYTNGEIYTYTTKIPYGPDTLNCSYYFSANDGTDPATGTPTTAINAPDVYGYYYVRSDGDDANSGTDYTAIQAWQSLTHALSQVRVGEILVAPGTYNEEVTPTNSGSAGYRIKVIADTDASDFPDVPAGEVLIDASGHYYAWHLDGNDYLDITGFTITGSSRHGIFLENDADDNNINGNKIFAVGTSGNYSGIRMDPGCDNTKIFDNDITGDYEGIRLTGTSNSLIYNNMIHGVGYYGIRMDQADATLCYFNSILNTNGHCVYKNQGTGNEFKNNIFRNTSSYASRYCIYIADGNKATYTFTSENNDLHAPNGAGVGYYGGSRITLPDWRSATVEDAASISTNPFFVSSTDLHIKDVSPCQGQGATIAGYSTDTDGDTRANPPDLGADENLNAAPISMSGTYTVKTDGSGDYPSVASAVTDVLNRGVSGPVVIDVYSGTYMGEVDITEIPGASALNTLTIREATGETAALEGDAYVIRLDGADYVSIFGFELSNSTRDGVSLTNHANDNSIIGNHIHDVGSSGSYSGIRVDTYSIRNTLANNQIQSDYYGVYLYDASDTKVYFNSLYNNHGFCVYKRYGTNNDFKNNIFAHISTNSGYYCFYNSDGNKATYTFTSDNNDYYTPSGASTGYYGGARVSLSDWQNATGEDASSISSNPIFVSSANLHIRDVSPCQGAGIAIAGFTTDYDGDARANPPDIGMDENLNAIPTPMSGTYTIKQDGSGDYQTFAAALADLYAKAVSGNVVFEVYSGTYMEQVDIDEIPGVGPASTVTFRKASGETVGVEGSTYVFHLNNTSYVNLEGFEISNASQHGIYIQNSNSISLKNNKIHDIGNSGSYASIRSDHSQNVIISNNEIISDYYGIYLYYTSNAEIYFNSISNVFGRCVHKYRGTGNVFLNNVFSNTSTNAGYYAFYNQDGNNATYSFTSNHNDFHCPNGASYGYYGGAQATLADWRSATGEDADSIDGIPFFLAADDLHIENLSSCQGAGIAVAGYAIDYDGDARANPPDIGMDENPNPVPIPMHGSYAVKQDGSGDFTTISSAISALNANGVNAPVSIDVYSGTYNEQVNISAVSGASSTNIVTFREFPGEAVVVNGDVYGFNLDGAEYVKLEGFEVTSTTQHGIYLHDSSRDNEITGNHIHDVGTSGSYAGIRLDAGCDSNKVSGNKIEGDYYGLYIYNSDDCEIYNNMISSAGYYGAYFNYCDNLKFYFNSIYNTVGRCIQKNRGTGNVFTNNILYNSSTNAGYYCFYVADGDKATYTFTSNFNDLKSEGASVGYYGSAQTDISAWRLATGEDADSLSVSPRFATTTDLHISYDSLCQGAGVAIPGYAIDYDGDAREDPPDIGADENIGAGTPMTGVYTVKQDGTGNYSSIAGAVSDLVARGVGAPVTVDVYSGTYNEEVEITPISGADASNTVTIKAAPGENATIDGLNQAFHLNGVDYLKIEGFDVTSTTRDAILLENNAENNVITGNNFYSVGTGGNYSAIRLNSGSLNNTIRDNKINGDYYGIYLLQATGTNIYNNMIYGVGYYGCYMSESNDTTFYFNSINNTIGRCIHKYRGTGNIFKNNILLNSSTNTGYYCFYNADGDKATYTFTSDYNDIYAPNGARTGYYAGNRTTLVDWRAATAEDASSISANPEFLSTTNLHIQTTSICNANGTAISGYTTDFDGDTRSAPPDIGADENLGGGGTPPMSGTYTVMASGGGNYDSIINAVADLNVRGVSGAVSIDVYSGTYSGGIIIEDIPNSSATNTVTIREFPGETVVVSGATYGFQLSSIHHLSIENFDVTATESHAFYLTNGASNNTISGNHIYETGTAGNYAGIRIDNACDNNTLDSNKIESDYYGIYLYYSDGTTISNNMISGSGYYGFYSSYASNTKFYFNSVRNSVGHCIHKYRGTGNQFTNNILYNTSTNSAYYCFYNADGDKATYTFTSDYNDLTSKGASIGYYGSALADIAAWRTATSEDANSISANPRFLSASDLHVENNSPCQGRGVSIAGFTNDFDGDARAATPDIGADENTVVPPTPMSGTYTVKLSGGDYSSIIAAVSDLNSKGISAPVSIDVYSGTYSGEVDLMEIVGASATNTVTIREFPGETAIVNGDTYAFYLDGTDFATIDGFEILSTTDHGVYLENGANDNVISGNHIHATGTAGSYAAIRVNNNCDRNIIRGNKIEGDYYGIYLYYADDTEISNNMISGTGYYGISLYRSNSLKCYFNSIHNTVGRCVYKYQGTNSDFKNNILYNSSTNPGYYCFYNADGDKATYPFTSDNNDLASAGASIGYYGGAMSNINDWRTTTNEDANSISSNPKFTTTDDLHIEDGSPCQGHGVAIIGYNDDFDGDARAATPDIGADENTNPPPPAMAGTYTVKQAGGGDFTSITDAVAALDLRGISAPVVIDVYSGTYSNQINLLEISGASSTNTITFQKHAGETSIVNGDDYGFYLNGADHIIIKGFDITSTTQYGVRMENGANNNELTGNHIYATGTSGSYAAVRIGTNCDGDKISANNIEGDYYGIYLYYADDTEIFNNMVTSTGYYGIYIYRSNNLKCYFNSISNTLGRCVYKYQGTNNEFTNNILSNSSTNAGYYCFYNADGDKATYPFTSDHNDLYAPNGANIGYYGSQRITLDDWRTATMKDANSLSVDPMFTSSTDLHIDVLSLCQSKGISIAGFTTDFDGDTRNIPPDIGADEVPLKLIVTPGTDNPIDGTISTLEQSDKVMMQIKFTTGDSEAVDISSITFTASGTGDDVTAISAVRLYNDLNNNGVVDGGDTQIGSDKTYSQDNGIITFNITETINVSSSENWLVTYNIPAGTTSDGDSFKVELAQYSHVIATGNTTGDTIICEGAPVAGGLITVDINYDGDVDELPDNWEMAHYGNLDQNAFTDTDGDKLSSFEEFVMGQDPTLSTSNIIHVDCNAGYIGDGSVLAPYKYLKDALDAATDGTLVLIADGVYELDNYNLATNVIVKGEHSASKTIIRCPAPSGTSADTGQLINVTSQRFVLSDATIRLCRDEQPAIAYSVDAGVEYILLKNLIFKDNSTATKSLIAPTGAQDNARVYILNCLFHDNDALSAAEIQGNYGKAYCNTIVDNNFATAFIASGVGDTFLINNILRNSSTEITNAGLGTLSVFNCNIEGGFPEAVDSYDAPEDFIDASIHCYRILPTSSAYNAGKNTFVNWDLDENARADAISDVGAFELNTTDTDGDGLTNAYESANGYNPNHPDSDHDGLSDGEEINIYGTDPTLTNSDGDFIDDGDEPAMGMDPAVPDGNGDIDGVYYTSFEDPDLFPLGPLANTIWGHNGNANNSGVIVGEVTIENIGAAAYDGSKVAKCAGQTPESSYIGWVDRNSLDNYWISIAWKMPRAKLPTDINEAFNIAGAFLAIDENGYLNIYYPKVDPPDPSPAVPPETWIKDTVVIPENTWITVTVHRDHPGKTVDVWLDISGSRHEAFAGVPISGPDPTAGTGKFRMSMSSVGEQDVFTDLWSALPFAPF